MQIQEITDLGCPELEIYTSLHEPQLLRLNEPEPGVFICETAKVIKRALHAGYEPVSMLTSVTEFTGEVAFVQDKCSNIPIYTAQEDVLKGLVGYSLTDGMLCAMRRKPLPGTEDILDGKRVVAVLEDVENPINVGTIFRSAAALGIEAVVLTYDCADPLYRRSIRVSMGTVFQIPWIVMPIEADHIDILKEAGYTTVAMALSDEAVSIAHPDIKKADKLAIILGNEGYGLDKDTIRRSDHVAKIPMNPEVDSLNVAAAGAVVFWELTRSV